MDLSFFEEVQEVQEAQEAQVFGLEDFAPLVIFQWVTCGLSSYQIADQIADLSFFMRLTMTIRPRHRFCA